MNFFSSSGWQKCAVHVLVTIMSACSKIWLFKLTRVMLVSLVTGCLAAPSYAAVPASWKSTGFAIDASGMTLSGVLQEFSTVYSVKINNAMAGDGVMHGRIQASNGADFLDRLASKYAFRWFVYNEVLYVVPNADASSLRLKVGEDAVADSKAALIGLGLFDARFGWGEIPDEGTVIVSGPRQYVELVRETLMPMMDSRQAGPSKQVMVFRLKYASATDRTMSTRGQPDNVIPGVKTILSSLLNSSSQNSIGNEDFNASSRKRSRTGKSGRGNPEQVTTSQHGGESSRTLLTNAREYSRNGRDGRDQNNSDDEEPDDSRRPGKLKPQGVKIDADPSLNAIIIYDNASKRAMYQSLITELDIEPQQIEIEALIVDIDRTKLNQLGAEWGFSVGNFSATFNGTSTDSKGNSSPISGSTLLIKNAANFYARLTAMESKGDAHVLAKPTISTLENIAAVLDLSQSAYLPLVGERVVDLANVNVGTMLKVTPRIVREGNLTRVRLDINIEDGAFTAQTASSANVTRSTITTQAIVELQHTLLIGGYHSEAKTQTKQKVPLLGDVPILGALFQNNSDSVSNRERLFLITPRITGMTAQQANAESTVASRAREMLQSAPVVPLLPLPPQKQRGGEKMPGTLPPLETLAPPPPPPPQRQQAHQPPPQLLQPLQPQRQVPPARNEVSSAQPGPAPDRVLASLIRQRRGAATVSTEEPAQADEVSQVPTLPRPYQSKSSKKKRKQDVLLLRFRS